MLERYLVLSPKGNIADVGGEVCTARPCGPRTPAAQGATPRPGEATTGVGAPSAPAACSPRAKPPPGGKRRAQRRPRAGGWESCAEPGLAPPPSLPAPRRRRLGRFPEGRPEAAPASRSPGGAPASHPVRGLRGPARQARCSPPRPPAPASVPPNSPQAFPTRAQSLRRGASQGTAASAPARPPPWLRTRQRGPGAAPAARDPPAPGPLHAAPPPPEPGPQSRLGCRASERGARDGQGLEGPRRCTHSGRLRCAAARAARRLAPSWLPAPPARRGTGEERGRGTGWDGASGGKGLGRVWFLRGGSAERGARNLSREAGCGGRAAGTLLYLNFESK